MNGTQITDSAAKLGAGVLGVGVTCGAGEAEGNGAIDDGAVGEGDGCGVHATSVAASRTRVIATRISASEYPPPAAEAPKSEMSSEVRARISSEVILVCARISSEVIREPDSL